MATHKTLEDFLEKCKGAKSKVDRELSTAREQLRYLEDSSVAIQAQIETLEQLMDSETPQKVEIPAAGEGEIEKLFDERLGKAELPNEEEMRSMRQEGVYKREASEIVDQIDEANSTG